MGVAQRYRITIAGANKVLNEIFNDFNYVYRIKGFPLIFCEDWKEAHIMVCYFLKTKNYKLNQKTREYYSLDT